MKKLFLLAVLCCLTFGSAKAQEVYKEVMRLSRQAATDRSKGLDSRKIATFKVDALNYMAMKSRELMPDSSMRMLDLQAYALYEYVNLYVKTLTEAAKKKDKDAVLELFKNVSLRNSRFYDMDKELVESYINPNFITHFSLDTDWEKALADVTEELKKKK